MTTAWFLMFLARLANLSVDSDSCGGRAGPRQLPVHQHSAGTLQLCQLLSSDRLDPPSLKRSLPERWHSMWRAAKPSLCTWKASMEGLIMYIIVVLQLPPSESSRMRVSLESLRQARRASERACVQACLQAGRQAAQSTEQPTHLQGMCCLSRLSVSVAITLPSADSEALIFFDSSSRLPVAPAHRWAFKKDVQPG